MNKVQCSRCGSFHERLLKTINKRQYFYNAAGKRWKNLNVCPDCSKYYSRIQMKKVHQSIKQELEESRELYPIHYKNKTCPICKGKLELSRYYSCIRCVRELPEEPGEFIYNMW